MEPKGCFPDGAQSTSALLIPDAPGQTTVSLDGEVGQGPGRGAPDRGPAWYPRHTAQVQIGWLSHGGVGA